MTDERPTFYVGKLVRIDQHLLRITKLKKKKIELTMISKREVELFKRRIEELRASYEAEVEE